MKRIVFFAENDEGRKAFLSKSEAISFADRKAYEESASEAFSYYNATHRAKKGPRSKWSVYRSTCEASAAELREIADRWNCGDLDGDLDLKEGGYLKVYECECVGGYMVAERKRFTKKVK